MTPPVIDTLRHIWQEVLEVDGIGADDDFFELGGDSVLAIAVIAQARERGLRISAKDFLSHSVLADLATRTQQEARP
jgi:aryl carrier-like protein